MRTIVDDRRRPTAGDPLSNPGYVSSRRADLDSGSIAPPDFQADSDTEIYKFGPEILYGLNRAQKLLSARLPLVIAGEYGSGKTAFSKIVISRCFGADADATYVDCGATNAELPALLRAALSQSGGCIILDRFDELQAEGQGALLQFLDADHRPIPERTALIALTAVELDQLAKEGALHPSLLLRLKCGHVGMRPLRACPDIGRVIADLLPLELAAVGKLEMVLSDDTKRVLENYYWPGNLRELRDALRHAIALAEGGVVEPADLPSHIISEIGDADLRAASQSEASRIEAALRHSNGNVSMTARYLGVSRATLYRKIQINRVRADHEKAPRRNDT